MKPRHLQRIAWEPNGYHPPDTTAWPFTIPAVAQLIAEGGLEIAPGVTFLVGENGSGKSTLVEAFAAIYPRSGHETSFAHVTGPGRSAEDSPLARHLRPRTHRMASPAGFFLRAESMHTFLTEVDANPLEAKSWGGERMQARSHGESFLEVLRHRFNEQGVYFLDEPEAALSFQSCLGLVSLLDTMRREGSQVIVATHSPLLIALPGATLLQLGDHGIARVESYDDLALIQHWRAFLAKPERYVRHLVEAPELDP
ncbi:MAG: AAA family ATPase [Polyangiaceae bacterium]|nr:AAA family ATPase [Polyangiaceae bacterium]